MPTSRRSLLKGTAATAAAMSLDWTRAQAQGETDPHRHDLRPVRTVRGGRLGRLLGRHPDRDRSRQREGRRRRQVQGRAGQRRFPEQGRCRDQRGRAPDQPGEGRHHQRRVRQRPCGAARRQDRAAEEDPLDHHGGLDRGVQGQEPALRLPRADPFRPVWPGLCAASSPRTPRPSSAWSRRTSRSRSSTRTAPMASASPPPTSDSPRTGGLQIVLKEGYSATAPDLSSLVTKLKRAGADVISHAGYNPDITLFLRQARENGLRFKMLFGNGAGYSQLDKLRADLRQGHRQFLQHRSGAGAAARSRQARAGARRSHQDHGRALTRPRPAPPKCRRIARWASTRPGSCSTACCRSPRQKYGGFDPEAVRKAALDVDIPAGGTIQGYGVKFFRPDTPMSGQNERSTPVVMQNAGEHITVVWPTNIRTQDPVLPLPKSSIYAAS